MQLEWDFTEGGTKNKRKHFELRGGGGPYLWKLKENFPSLNFQRQAWYPVTDVVKLLQTSPRCLTCSMSMIGKDSLLKVGGMTAVCWQAGLCTPFPSTALHVVQPPACRLWPVSKGEGNHTGGLLRPCQLSGVAHVKCVCI